MTDLSKTEKAIIADWFETEAYQVYKKVLELRRLANGGRLLTENDEKRILKIQGAAQEDVDLHQYFKTINKESRKKS